MASNLDGVLFGAQVARQMRAPAKRRRIVLIASLGWIASAAMTAAYLTSKSSVVVMAKALADALGPEASTSTRLSRPDRYRVAAHHP